jgi:hypothetical protein
MRIPTARAMTAQNGSADRSAVLNLEYLVIAEFKWNT